MLLCTLLVISLAACRSVREVPFEKPVDTSNALVQRQPKQSWDFGKLHFSNTFDGARLNNIRRENDSTFIAIILPENAPINPSPWYAFRIKDDSSRVVNIILDYGEFKHRYYPKLKRADKFTPVDSADVITLDEHRVLVRCTTDRETITLAAQPIEASRDVQNWALDIAEAHDLTYSIYGKSIAGKPLGCLEISSGRAAKPLVVLLCRQHPPEVTGWYALQNFILEILENESLRGPFLEKYTVLIFPILNPDGVDNGFWRHNLGGVDLNRDWAEYNQPEIKQTVDFIIRKSAKHSVVLALDFHSTYNDVFYTNDESDKPSAFPEFKQDWLDRLESYAPEFNFRESSSMPETPVSKNWFYRYFNATAITFEIGDNTPTKIIEKKGRASAKAMMELLIAAKVPTGSR